MTTLLAVLWVLWVTWYLVRLGRIVREQGLALYEVVTLLRRENLVGPDDPLRERRCVSPNSPRLKWWEMP